MALCQFCGKALNEIDDAGIIKCRFCRATFELYEYAGTGQVKHIVNTEPPAEFHNRCLTRKQLLDAADKVVTAPGDALAILEDAWVGLWDEAKGPKNQLIDELDKLRSCLLVVAKGVMQIIDSLSYVDLHDDPTKVAGTTLDELRDLQTEVTSMLTVGQIESLRSSRNQKSPGPLRELLASTARTVAGVLDSFQYTDSDPTMAHMFGALSELYEDIKEYSDGS